MWRSALIVTALAVISGGLCWWIEGPEAFQAVLVDDLVLLLEVIPRIAAGVFLVGFLTVLIPPEPIARWLGHGSGLTGLVIASIAGSITPGGPWVVFPVTVMFARSGADVGACITYVTAWGLISVQRMMVWEIAFLGVEFSLIRWAACLPLPLLAGLIARRFLSATAKPVGPER